MLNSGVSVKVERDAEREGVRCSTLVQKAEVQETEQERKRKI